MILIFINQIIRTATTVSWWLMQKATNKSRVELIYQQEIDDATIESVQACDKKNTGVIKKITPANQIFKS